MIYKIFISNYQYPYFYGVKCPICRLENKFDKLPNKIYGVNDKCNICFENKIDMVFHDCGHLCCCLECFKNINSIRYMRNPNYQLLFDSNLINDYNINFLPNQLLILKKNNNQNNDDQNNDQNNNQNNDDQNNDQNNDDQNNDQNNDN